MKVKIIPIVIGAFGTVTKGLLKGLEDLEVEGQVETIQTTALLRTARILRRVLENCCHSNSSEKPSANTGMKKSQKRTNNNNFKKITIIILIWELIFYLLQTFCPYLGSFCVVSSFTTSIHCATRGLLGQKTWCDRQQLWKAVITGDMVIRLSISIQGHSKSPEEGLRWNLAET